MKSVSRTPFVLALVLVVAFLAAGCAARQATAPDRATPSGTVEMFKMKARYGDRTGEWDILSPDFKARLSQQVGRTIDVADYTQARDMYRGDPQVKLAEKMLQTAIATNVRQVGPDRARVAIQTSGGPFAKSGEIGMVRLQTWKLQPVGGAQAYSGFVGDPMLAATKQADGSFVVTSGGNTIATVPANQVADYKVESYWYVDDLGGMEQQFLQIGSVNSQRPVGGVL